MAYPHQWSPISCRSSAGQGKFAGQRPTFYHCATPPTTVEIGDFYDVTETQSLTEHVCVVVGSQRESTAFAAERRRLPQHCAHSCRSISPVCTALSSKPAGRRCCCRPTGQTDRRTDARALHRPIQRQQVRQVNNL